MEGRVDKQMDGGIKGRMGRWLDGRMDKGAEEWAKSQVGKWVVAGWPDRRTAGGDGTWAEVRREGTTGRAGAPGGGPSAAAPLRDPTQEAPRPL